MRLCENFKRSFVIMIDLKFLLEYAKADFYFPRSYLYYRHTGSLFTFVYTVYQAYYRPTLNRSIVAICKHNPNVFLDVICRPMPTSLKLVGDACILHACNCCRPEFSGIFSL